ncbi:MAG: M23 family metallopeptidase [Deltaproteobacteria bacterium]|nr:M23 family metallopeptidase [Deltaproteobacteria bacterium]
MGKRKKTGLYITIMSIIILLGTLGWFLNGIFEGEKPGIKVELLPEFISDSTTFTMITNDNKSGLKHLKIVLEQEGRKINLFEKRFPFQGLINCDGFHSFEKELSINPSKLNLAQGGVELNIYVWDYSKRRGGDGNRTLFRHKMVVDTIPPAVRAVSRRHYINLGGTGLVIYQTSSDTVESGLFVNDNYFPGILNDQDSKQGLHVCFFAVPYNTKPNPDIYLWAKDRAGNYSKATFYYNIRRKRFPTDTINVSDTFLKRVLPYFSNYSFDPGASDINKFLQINRNVRAENNLVLFNLRTKTAPVQIWKGKWLRLGNAANMAGFGDRRQYVYHGKMVDKEIHLGIDLASFTNADVQAANNGRVIFTGSLGIYGQTVVLDHGQGLASVYSHLSEIRVKPDQEVSKGEIIGRTGKTGLAAGDHLHFGIMVNGVPVNPIEWWDSHWIQDNIIIKQAVLK